MRYLGVGTLATCRKEVKLARVLSRMCTAYSMEHVPAGSSPEVHLNHKADAMCGKDFFFDHEG